MNRRTVSSWIMIAGLVGSGCSFATEEFSLRGADSGARDTGTQDVGTDLGRPDDTADTGPADTGPADTDPADTGPADTNPADTDPSDTGPADAGVDVGAADAGSVDASAADAGADAGPADAEIDAGTVIFCATARPCPTGLVCDDGICAAACPVGQQACSGACRATQTDVTHCGACGVACAAGQECRAGACTTVCSAPTTNCSNVCRDLQADNNHCGICGRACTRGTACFMGTCVCPGGQTLCGGVCVNLQTDATYCGSCTRACSMGQLCSAGACVTTCGAGLTNCAGVCRNLQTDLSACGACGTPCTAPTGGTATCTGGVCTLACPTGRTNCGGVCVDVTTDAANCGRCGTACPLRLTTCTAGLCCARGSANCSGVCRDLQTDEANCGACGRVCTPGNTCRLGACEPNFHFATMTATNCRAVDQLNIVGDDRGGLVANSSYAYYSGDIGTGRALAADLSGLTLVPPTPAFDGLVTNLRTGVVYSLSTDGSTPFRAGGVPAGNFTTLLELNGATLVATGVRITLSAPIAYDPALWGRYGVFSGYDRVVIHNGARAYNITLTTGAVTDLGTVPIVNPQTCENWAYWGVAEFFNDAIWLVYRQGGGNNIIRGRVPDGLTQVVGAFTNLSDMCSIAALPGRARWYWHHEGISQFSNFASGEALGYCDATFLLTN